MKKKRVIIWALLITASLILASVGTKRSARKHPAEANLNLEASAEMKGEPGQDYEQTTNRVTVFATGFRPTVN